MDFELEKRIETIHGEICDMLRISTNEGVINLAIPVGSEVEIDTRSLDRGDCLTLTNKGAVMIEGIVRVASKKKKISKKAKAQIKILEEIKELMRLDCPDQHSIIVEEKISELKGE